MIIESSYYELSFQGLDIVVEQTNFHCDVKAFVSPVTRSAQIKQIWADARINKQLLY